MRDTHLLATTPQPTAQTRLLARYAPLLGLLALTLFPFGWLGQLWPVFGRAIDDVFPTDTWHAVGHASLFFVLSLVALHLLPRLRAHPWWYLGLMLLVGAGQELFQMLYKGRLQLFDNSRDLLTDMAGVLVAFLVVWGWQRMGSKYQF
jgi:hypothetical protein